MAETLREKLNRIDLRCIDEDLKFYDLRSLFEATAPRLSPEDKEEIKKVIQNTDDAETIAAVLQAKAMDKNESLEEDVDSLQSRIFDFLDELGGYADYNQRIEEVSDEFGMSPDEVEGYVWDWTLNSEAEWHDTADQEEDESLQEKLVDAPQEVIDKLLEILKKYGFILDDSVGHENPIRSAIFGDVHIQVINPDSHIDDDEISFDRQMETYISRNMIDEISRLDDEYNCPITWNFGPNNKGQVTGGLDIMKQYIPDEADECLSEKLDLSDYEELSYPLRDGGKNYQLFRKLENGKGKWAAAPMEMGDVKYDDAFEITYDQARGFEPINTIGKLSRDLGKKLLPKRESLKESSEPTDEDWEDFYKLEEEIANVMHGIDSDLDDAQANIYHDDSDGTRRLTFRFVCGVNKISDRTRKQIINALENYLNKTKFNQFIYIRLYPIDVPVGASYEVIIDAETEPDENLTEASYGGAYDIEDDMYFTKEELVEFGDDLAEQFSAWADDKCELSDVYMTSPVDLVMEVAENDGVEHQAKVKIDMRKIRLPRDIEKYTDIILKQWKDSYNEYHSYDESLNEDYLKDIVKAVRDFTQNYAAEQGQFNPDRFDPDYINDLMDEFRANGYSVGYSVKDPSKDDTDLENQVYWFEKEFNKEEVDKLRNRLLELNKAVENGEDPESVAWEKEKIFNRLDEIGVDYYTESLDDDTPYTYEQMERELKSATNEWTEDNFEGWVGYKDEFDSAMQILSHHYENVDNLGHTHRGYGFFATRPSLFEDTVKQNGKWVNKGKEGTHGKFATKKAADAQRRAMFANGYKEGLNEEFSFGEKDGLFIIYLDGKEYMQYPSKEKAEEAGWILTPNDSLFFTFDNGTAIPKPQVLVNNLEFIYDENAIPNPNYNCYYFNCKTVGTGRRNSFSGRLSIYTNDQLRYPYKDNDNENTVISFGYGNEKLPFYTTSISDYLANPKHHDLIVIDKFYDKLRSKNESLNESEQYDKEKGVTVLTGISKEQAEEYLSDPDKYYKEMYAAMGHTYPEDTDYLDDYEEETGKVLNVNWSDPKNDKKIEAYKKKALAWWENSRNFKYFINEVIHDFKYDVKNTWYYRDPNGLPEGDGFIIIQTNPNFQSGTATNEFVISPGTFTSVSRNNYYRVKVFKNETEAEKFIENKLIPNNYSKATGNYLYTDEEDRAPTYDVISLADAEALKGNTRQAQADYYTQKAIADKAKRKAKYDSTAEERKAKNTANSAIKSGKYLVKFFYSNFPMDYEEFTVEASSINDAFDKAKEKALRRNPYFNVDGYDQKLVFNKNNIKYLGESLQKEIKNESLSDEKEYRAFLGRNKNANSKFDYKKYGKYFDKDGKIIPELEDEFFSIIKTADLSEAYVDADKDILDIIRSDKEYNANYHVKTHTPDFSAIPDGTVITLKSLNKYHPEVKATIEKISDNNWKYVYSYGDDSWDRYLDNYHVMREINEVDRGAYESLNELYTSDPDFERKVYILDQILTKYPNISQRDEDYLGDLSYDEMIRELKNRGLEFYEPDWEKYKREQSFYEKRSKEIRKLENKLKRKWEIANKKKLDLPTMTYIHRRVADRWDKQHNYNDDTGEIPADYVMESLNEAYSIGYVKCNPYNADLIYSVSIEGPYENRDGEKYNLVNLYLICGKDYVDAESYDGIAWVDANQWVDDIQFEQLVWYPESESLNDVFEENEYEPCNKPNAIWHYNEEKDKWYRDKNFYNEDYQDNKDEWGEPYSFDEVERELKNITNDWTDEEGTIRCYWEQEKEYGMQILQKHYDIVEPSDGRTGPGEEMSWVLAYAKPKAPLNEGWTRDDYLRLEHDGYVDIDRVEDYIWAKYEGDIDDKKACARSLMNTKIYQDEGKVGIDVINEFSGAHNLVEREDFDESLNKSTRKKIKFFKRGVK